MGTFEGHFPSHVARISRWCDASSRGMAPTVLFGPRTFRWDSQRVLESRGGAAMPVYEYYCDNCRRDVSVTLSISEHDKAKVACPQCGSTALRPLVSSFFSRTSRKS